MLRTTKRLRGCRGGSGLSLSRPVNIDEILQVTNDRAIMLTKLAELIFLIDIAAGYD